jgi:hypothetical protein
VNLLQMRTTLRARIGNPTTTDTLDSVLDGEINAAYTDIVDRYRFHLARKRCRFDTIAGEARYDLPTDVLVVMRLSDITNYRKLIKWGDRQLNSVDNYTAQGKPIYYVRYRNWVELSPIPDGIYTIEVFYKYAHAPITDDQQIPNIPLSWHEGIVLMAKHKYYSNIENDQVKAAMAYESFKLWVSDKPTEIDEESVDIDSGVEIVPLSKPTTERLDFDHSN